MAKYSKETYKNYHFLKECPLCQKEYDEHWKVVNHIRKTKNVLHQTFLKEQEKEVIDFYVKNEKGRWNTKKMLYKERNIFAGISHEKLLRLIAMYLSADELEKIRIERISRTMKTVPKTAKHNKKVSIAVKKAWKDGKFHTEEMIKARELGYLKRRSYVGEGNPMFGRSPGKGAGFGKGGKRADLNNQYFRSTWESNLARILELVHRPYIFEPERFYVVIDNVEYSYLPDFYFPTKNFYYEVKGHAASARDWTCKCPTCIKNRLKMNQIIVQYNLKIFIIGNYEYKRLRRIFKDSILEWEE